MQYRLQTLTIALGVAPPVLAGIFWLATRSSDFFQVALCILIGLVLGLLLSLPILWHRKSVRQWIARKYVPSKASSYRLSNLLLCIYAFGFVMFLLIAWFSVQGNRLTGAAWFSGMAVLQLAGVGFILWYRVFPVAAKSEGTPAAPATAGETPAPR